MQSLDSEVRYAWIQSLCLLTPWFSGSLVFSKLFWLQNNSISLVNVPSCWKARLFSPYVASTLPAIFQTDQTPPIRNEKPSQWRASPSKERYQSPSLFSPRKFLKFPTPCKWEYLPPLWEFLCVQSPFSYQPLQSAAWPGPSFLRLPMEKMCFSRCPDSEPCHGPGFPSERPNKAQSGPGHL